MPAMSSFRTFVESTDCDFLGHMNVARYFSACSNATGTIQAELGLTGEDMRTGRRLCFAVVHADSSFRAELNAGDSIQMMTDILAIGTKSMTFRHRLYRVDDGALCFETSFKTALMNLTTRKAAAIPDDVRAKAQAYLATD